MGTPIQFGVNNDQNAIVQVSYDKAGRMTTRRDPLGHLTRYSYDQLNRRTSLTDPLSHTWNTAYANLPGGAVQTTLTDPLANQVRQTTDRLGRLSSVQYLGETAPKPTPDVSYAYDKLSNLLNMTETNGLTTIRQTVYGYDQTRRLSSAGFDTNNDGLVDQTVGYQYDPGGLRTQLTLPDGKTLSYQYDARGQLVGLTDWTAQTTRWDYDSLGRLTGIERANGLRSGYQYDPASRLTQLRHTAGKRTLAQFNYSLDARGNRIQVFEALPRASTGATTLSYNDPAIVYSPAGAWTAAAPFMLSTRFSAVMTVAFFGDQATLTLGTGPDHSICDVVVDGALYTSLDGYAATAGSQTLTLSLTNDGPHLLEIRNRAEKNTRSSGYSLRFQSLATPATARLYDLQTTLYSYDSLARLLAADTYPAANTGAHTTLHYGYAFDGAGNRTQQSVQVGLSAPTTTNYTYDAANRLTSDGVHSYTYDTAGRMTSDGVNTYTWDNANRLLKVNNTAYQYAYDGQGRRVQQTAAGVVTNYLLDVQPGLWKLLTATTSGNVTRYIPGPLGLHEQINPTGVGRWPILDGLGSVRVVLDDSLTPQESRLYSPFGEPTQQSGSSQTVFGFTGEPTDGTGQVYLRARYYNPTIGQFPSLDPLEGDMGSPMSLNRYGYVQGNPTNMVDPSGMLFWDYPAARAQRGFSGRGIEMYDPANYAQREKAYSGPWIAKFMEIVNGFGATHLEFHTGWSQEVDAIVFGSSSIDVSSLNSQERKFRVQGSAQVYEIEPLLNRSGYVYNELAKGYLEVHSKLNSLRMSKNTNIPFSLVGILPADRWPIPQFKFPQAAYVEGMPYDWNDATWQLGNTLYVTGLIPGMIPGFPRLGIFAPFTTSNADLTVPTIYYIYLVTDGFIIYITEREAEQLLGEVAFAHSLGEVASKVFGKMEDEYNGARGEQGLPPVMEPVPRFAMTSNPYSRNWSLSDGINKGLCEALPVILATAGIAWAIKAGFSNPLPVPPQFERGRS